MIGYDNGDDVGGETRDGGYGVWVRVRGTGEDAVRVGGTVGGRYEHAERKQR